jgi:S-adenosylmethionine:tRNA ribosyltransferase-isomerase
MLSIHEFDYSLPEDNIAQYPLPDRDRSKLLIYNKGNIQEDIFLNIDNYLPENSAIFYNNTKVINARLFFKNANGANIEIFCLEPLDPSDYNLAFQQSGTCRWACLVGNLRKWKKEPLSQILSTSEGEITLTASFVENKGNWQEIIFSWSPANIPFGQIIDEVGKIPLPPYIKREAEEIDKIRYQTIFSKLKGSVAAPTAALHFTENVITSLNKKHIEQGVITLHVGAGTFRPVKEDNVLQHEMHTEHFSISIDALKLLRQYYENITVVGTTTLRTVESTYWLGVKLMQQSDLSHLFVNQWDYNMLPQPDAREVIDFLVEYCRNNNIDSITAETKLMIVPGYKFKLINRLITNFHQPQSTLLLLIAAFIGKENWREVYNYALTHNFRFLSYGDSSLLIP